MCLVLLYTTIENHNMCLVLLYTTSENHMCLVLLYTTIENHNYVSSFAIHNNRES